MDMWLACEFEIDVSNVLKTNVTKGRGRLLTAGSTATNWWKGSSGKSRTQSINEGLFGKWEDEYDVDEVEDKYKDEIEPAFWEMKQYLIRSSNFSWAEVNKLSPDEVKDNYWLERLDEYEDEQAGIIKNDTELDDVGIHFNLTEQMNMLVADNIISRDALTQMKKAEISAIFDEVYGQ